MASISNFVRDMESSLDVERIAKKLREHDGLEGWDELTLRAKTRYRKAAAAAWVILNDKEDQ